ncbi:MAG: iron export ABC transporter permease subunit FetB [Planctomycetaceae bacterium]
MSYHDLSALEVAVAATLILINGAISLVLGLGLERRLAIAAARTVVQLLLLGWVLQWIFEARHWSVIVGMMLVMSAIAGVSAVRRTERRYPGVWSTSLTAVMASSWIVLAVALVGVMSPSAWSANPAQYAIPLMGMILGNTLNGISLGLDRLTEELLSRRAEVELRLCLGATRWEAARPYLATAVRTGMVPIINSMMVVGLVSLPGMMTGQILAGTVPMAAVRYQIVIMFLIAAGTALGTTAAVLLGYRCLFNRQHQFLSGAIRKAT